MITQNPYQVSRPITDPDDLFGRKTEFDLIYQMLLSGESVNIMGPRRIGKSSFLRMLPQLSIQQRVLDKPVFDEQTMFVFVDMESQKTATPLQFFTRLVKQFNQNGLNITTEVHSYDDFEASLEQLTLNHKRLIILLDEFDCVAQNKEFDVLFYDMLRYYQQQYAILYAVASSKRVKELCKSPVASSPFFNIFRFLRLGLLTEDAANDLICKDDSLSLYLHFVKLIAGQHPFFISQLCFYLFYFQQRQAEMPPEEIRQEAVQRFLEEAFDHFAYYWEHLSTDEKAVLKKLANGKKPDKDDAAELIDLEQKALIARHNGNYSIFSTAFEGFVKEVEFSEMKEELTQFFTKNTRALVSITKYCLDKAVELKK